MGKSKRINKKKIIKHNLKKKIVKNHNNKTEKSSNETPMSKLEYQQNMMDPRFRAAMMGFNNPNGISLTFSR